MQEITDKIISANEAAKLLGISKTRLMEFVRSDKPIPYYQERERGKYRFRSSEILEWYTNKFRRA